MPCMPRHLPVAVLLPFLLLVPGWAQKTDKDLLEVQHYTLTMDKVTRASQVTSDAAAAEKADPSLTNSLEAKDADDTDHASLDQMADRLASSPTLVAILKKNGFTPREYIVMTMALVQSSMAVYAKPKDETVEQYAAKIHANPENIVFVQQHAAELQQMHKKTDAQGKKHSGDGDSEKSDPDTE